MERLRIMKSYTHLDDEERAALNYDHPDSLETDLLVQHVQALRDGQMVEIPVYDFARHARQQATETITPRKAIIVEGILIFTDPALRKLMDVKVFVDADDDTRFIRRLQRDLAERGAGRRVLPGAVIDDDHVHMRLQFSVRRMADSLTVIDGGVLAFAGPRAFRGPQPDGKPGLPAVKAHLGL